jgi:hypothetical protein
MPLSLRASVLHLGLKSTSRVGRECSVAFDPVGENIESPVRRFLLRVLGVMLLVHSAADQWQHRFSLIRWFFNVAELFAGLLLCAPFFYRIFSFMNTIMGRITVVSLACLLIAGAIKTSGMPGWGNLPFFAGLIGFLLLTVGVIGF